MLKDGRGRVREEKGGGKGVEVGGVEEGQRRVMRKLRGLREVHGEMGGRKGRRNGRRRKEEEKGEQKWSFGMWRD